RHQEGAHHQRWEVLARGGCLPRCLRRSAGGARQQFRLLRERHAGLDEPPHFATRRATRPADGAGARAAADSSHPREAEPTASNGARGGDDLGRGWLDGAEVMAGPARILTVDWDKQDSFALATYQASGGYKALPKALKMQPQQIVDEVVKSNLRGRGGAGFPTGMKGSFVRKETTFPKYLTVNADEGEPGTFKDREILLRSPHMFVEGLVIGCYAIECHLTYVYCRGEFRETAMKRVQQAIDEAYQEGYAGKNILGSGYDLDIRVVYGAGAYICGEATAMLESIEGRKGYPRLKPPFPAGASSAIMTAEEIDWQNDFDTLKAKKTMAGSGAVVYLDQTVNMAHALANVMRFFAHESCGQCTPCREGTAWLSRLLDKISGGKGEKADVDNVHQIARQMEMKTICALADGAAMPAKSYIEKFRADFDALVRG